MATRRTMHIFLILLAVVLLIWVIFIIYTVFISCALLFLMYSPPFKSGVRLFTSCEQLFLSCVNHIMRTVVSGKHTRRIVSYSPLSHRVHLCNIYGHCHSYRTTPHACHAPIFLSRAPMCTVCIDIITTCAAIYMRTPITITPSLLISHVPLYACNTLAMIH